MEVEAFERKAQVTWRSSAGRALSESSPTASEVAIEQMMQQRPGRRDQIFYSCKEMAAITRLPTFWLQQNQKRQRLGVPFYKLVNGDVTRFSIEELFLWEMHHLRPCRYPTRGNTYDRCWYAFSSGTQHNAYRSLGPRVPHVFQAPQLL